MWLEIKSHDPAINCIYNNVQLSHEILVSAMLYYVINGFVMWLRGSSHMTANNGTRVNCHNITIWEFLITITCTSQINSNNKDEQTMENTRENYQ